MSQPRANTAARIAACASSSTREPRNPPVENERRP
jgi:hypothetical protein